MLQIIKKIVPGILLSATIAISGVYLSEIIGKEIMGFKKSPISAIMISIILGLIIGNVIKLPEIFNEGIQFSLKLILRFGIICLGIRLGLLDILKIGVIGIPLIILCIVSALVIVNYLSKLIDVPSKMAALIAVGTSICGATAIVATGPAINAKKEEITYAIANITIFGIIAMFAYPFLANFIFSGDELSAGLFIGTSIHETAQVAGAGLIYAEQFNAPQSLDIATVTKLVRNTSMMIVIPLMSYLYHNKEQGDTKQKISVFQMFPMFILGFIFLGIFRSIGDYGISTSNFAFGLLDAESWKESISIIKLIAEYSLGIAMAAVGLSTNLVSLKKLGIKPFYVGFAAAASVGAVSIVGINIIQIFI